MTREKIMTATAGLGVLTERNVQAVYEKELLKWSLLNSDKVSFDGEDISKHEIALKFLLAENQLEKAKGIFTYCNTQKGFTLTREMFHQEQINRYEPIQFFTQGKPQHRIINARVNLYLNYVKRQAQKPKFEFVNNFDNVPEADVYNYFHQKLVETNMLTEKELYQYLKTAFEEKKKPKKRFVLRNSKGRGKTIKIFNKYSNDVAGRRNGELKKYVGLLGDYFEGYLNDNSLYSNFNK